MKNLFGHHKFLVMTGNYGSGKTEISLNTAFQFAENEKTTLVDLDIVNPYFRSGEKAEELKEKGIRVLMPTFALSTVDIPALPAEIQSVFENPCDRVIFDVGGDDTGAAALGRYYPSFAANREQTLVSLVINFMRPLTQNIADVIDLYERIRNRGRLEIDMIINNTNLAGETTPDMIEQGEAKAMECAHHLGIRQVCSSGMEDIIRQCRLQAPFFCVRRHMKPEWMDETP